MRLLAIDTTGAFSSTAIYDDGIIAQIINEDDYSHLQKLVPGIKLLMDEEEVKPEDIDAVAVSRGPGSFTGIRIGMATAKGLAQIWNKPIVEVPTLATFAFCDYSWTDEENALYCPVFDAKRMQVYAAAYEKNNKEAVYEHRIIEPGSLYCKALRGYPEEQHQQCNYRNREHRLHLDKAEEIGDLRSVLVS